MELRCPISNALVDKVFKYLALALLPAIAHPDEANKLFLEHAGRAVKVHLARHMVGSGVKRRAAGEVWHLGKKGVRKICCAPICQGTLV